MVKYSFIIPMFGNLISGFVFQESIKSLLKQSFRDFEIIISGNQVLENNIEYMNGIKITNLVIDSDNMAKLLNPAIKISEGEYIQMWSTDLVVYSDYLEDLNSYISKYGENVYAGKLIDTGGLQSKNEIMTDDIYFKSFDYVEGFSCIPKKYFEPFREEFGGVATHVFQEHCYRLWKKLKFIQMKNTPVIHIPHPRRISEEEASKRSKESSILFNKIVRENV